MTITNFKVVVETVVVIFNFERLELESNLISFCDSDLPNALFVGSIVFRIIWTLKSSFILENLATTKGWSQMKYANSNQLNY